MMDDFEIRPAAAGDRETVEGLLRAAGLPPDGLDEQFGESYAVAVSDRRIVGAAGVEVYGGAGLLRSVVVDAAWRGRGLGAALTRERLAWARERGLDSVYLLTDSAGEWFPRLGFASVDREQVPDAVRRSLQFASVCPSSASVMMLDLREMARAAH
jgi:amino-acid N-acetyltransferase